VNRCKAELVISFGEKTNVLVLAACWALRQRVVVCERTDPRHHSIGQSWSWLRRRVYPRCDALVVQTEAVRSWARGLLSRRPIYVIPNAAPPPREFGEHAGSLARLGRCIVGLGRLSPEKGFDLLISAFSRIADKYPEWQLRIWGDGAARSALEQLVKTSSLEKRVELPGWTSAPEAALAHADVFVLPSRYEGFPNALLEAMAQGKACVSFDCESGPREIIRDGVDGILVRTIHAEDLAAALTRVLSDTKLRRQLGENARHVAARYSPERFFQLWDLVVDGVSEECLERFASRLTERKD
jgi:glycosyltransferase involved in cell wall biosynthesis